MKWAVVIFEYIWLLTSYNNISTVSDQEKCKTLISWWWRAVCSLAEWSQWKKGINLALLIRDAITAPSLACVLWCHASLHLICIHSCPICLLTPFAGLQASCVLGFSSLLPYSITFPPCTLPPSLCYSLLCVIVIADPSICTRCGWGLGSFNLPNKPTASFSSMRNKLLCSFWICVSRATLKHFPALYWESHRSLSILIH